MKVWILNLVGLSMFGILVEILLPNGNTNKYIKGVVSLMIVYVIISPIVSIFNGNKIGDFSDFIKNDIVIDNDFIADYNVDSNNAEEKFIVDILCKEGYKNIEIDIVSNIISQEQIEYVKIKTKNMVIDENVSNINIKEHIIEVVSKRLKIDSSRILYE